MKDTTNQQTPIMTNLLTLVRDYGHKKAVAWLQSEDELGYPDDDLTSFLARHDVDFIFMDEKDKDTLRDEYIESVKSTMASRVSSPVTVEVPLGKPGGPSATSESLDRVGSDVPPVERLLTEAHDAMVEAEDALTEFCGHNDETRGGWALQSLTRSIENIRAIQRIAGFKPFSLTPPVSTQSHGDASLPYDRDNPSAILNSYCSRLPEPLLKRFHNDAVFNRFLKNCAHLGLSFESVLMEFVEVQGQTMDAMGKAFEDHLAQIPTSIPVTTPPSPEKPVVQPTGSDFAGLLEECRRVLEIILPMAQRGRGMSGPFSETDQIMDEAANLYTKLNA